MDRKNPYHPDNIFKAARKQPFGHSDPDVKHGKTPQNMRVEQFIVRMSLEEKIKCTQAARLVKRSLNSFVCYVVLRESDRIIRAAFAEPTEEG